MQADDVRLGQEGGQIRLFDAERGAAVGRDVGVVDEHAHLESTQVGDEQLADVAEANQADGLAVKLASADGIVVDGGPPFARSQGAVGAGDAFAFGQDEAEGELGDGAGVAAGREEDGNAALGGGGQVDVDRAAAEAADDF